MSVPTTYSELQTEIARYLHRTDLTSDIKSFIGYAESRINRLVPMALMETEASLSMTLGSRFVAYPSDMAAPIAAWNATFEPRQSLRFVIAQELPVSTASGCPQYVAVDGANLGFDLLADQAYAITFRYLKRLTLSDANPTNAVLDRYPDLYLYGSLLEAAPLTVNIEMISVWQERFDRAVSEVSNMESRSRSIGTLSTELAHNGSTFDINRGY